jgi:hypothetical protein
MRCGGGWMRDCDHCERLALVAALAFALDWVLTPLFSLLPGWCLLIQLGTQG